MAELNDTEMEKEKESKENQIDSLKAKIKELNAAAQKESKITDDLKSQVKQLSHKLKFNFFTEFEDQIKSLKSDSKELEEAHARELALDLKFKA